MASDDAGTDLCPAQRVALDALLRGLGVWNVATLPLTWERGGPRYSALPTRPSAARSWA